MAKQEEIAALKIPPQYVTWMRFAALHELKYEAEGLVEQVEEAREGLFKWEMEKRHYPDLGEPGDFDHMMSNLNGTRRHSAESFVAISRLCEEEQPESITGTPEALVWLLDSFCRHAVARELSDTQGALEASDGENHAATFIAALQWAGDEAIRLRAEHWTESLARRAEIEVEQLNNVRIDAEKRGMSRADFMSFCEDFLRGEGDDPEPGVWARLGKALDARIGEQD